MLLILYLYTGLVIDNYQTVCQSGRQGLQQPDKVAQNPVEHKPPR